MPFICFRVVTRGDFPGLVRTNVQRNVNICRDAGLENFMVEVVTGKSVILAANCLWTRELVVPPSYKTQSGALFKARALQYCLEDEALSKNIVLNDFCLCLLISQIYSFLG